MASIDSWIIVVLMNRATGQLIKLASVGVDLHKNCSITSNDGQLGQQKSIHENHVIE